MRKRLSHLIISIAVVVVLVPGLGLCDNRPSTAHADWPTPTVTATPAQPDGQPGGSGGGGI
jgi:hypothetical protein